MYEHICANRARVVKDISRLPHHLILYNGPRCYNGCARALKGSFATLVSILYFHFQCKTPFWYLLLKASYISSHFFRMTLVKILSCIHFRSYLELLVLLTLCIVAHYCFSSHFLGNPNFIGWQYEAKGGGVSFHGQYFVNVELGRFLFKL